MSFILIEYIKYIYKCTFISGKNNSNYSKRLNEALHKSKKSSKNFNASEEIRKTYKKRNDEIEILDFGAGSKIFNTNKRKISDMVKYACLPQKYGRLLSCICAEFEVKAALEMGTSLGLTTLYLSHSHPNIEIHTIEVCPQTSEIAKRTFEQSNSNNIQIHLETFESFLNEGNLSTDINFVFIDGNHTYQATLSYYKTLHEKLSNNSILIFDDIRHSKEMLKAWKHICNLDTSFLCIDLFRLGIVFLSPQSGKNLTSRFL